MKLLIIKEAQELFRSSHPLITLAMICFHILFYFPDNCFPLSLHLIFIFILQPITYKSIPSLYIHIILG